MVCHETYKDENNNWVSPEEIESDDGKNFYVKGDKNNIVKVGPSESMSKSKKNTIDPEKIIKIYGADAVRLFILSDSPPEKDVQWSESGMNSSFKFVQKFWLMSEDTIKLTKTKKDSFNKELEIFTNQSISKINFALDKFRYNVIIAVFHEIYSFFKKVLDENKNYENLNDNLKKILIVISPVLPHLASECLDKIDKNSIDIKWPKINEEYLNKEETIIVIQVNGKKRSSINIKEEIDEKNLFDKIKKMQLIEKYIKNKKIIKTIYIKNRIINVIVK